MQKAPYEIIIFLIGITLLTTTMIGFIVYILHAYRERQIAFLKNTEKLMLDYEKNLLSARLEIQEETFLTISREIHDNISLSLTLAKLHLNTLDYTDRPATEQKVNQSLSLLSSSINQLREISGSLNAELITDQGLLKALDNEIKNIENTGRFTLAYRVDGNPVYLDAQRELIIFRIIQEAFNNIIRHSGAGSAELRLNYNATKLYVDISDNGKGFDPGNNADDLPHAGIKNMQSRTKILNGQLKINSLPGQGTTLSLTIPYEQE